MRKPFLAFLLVVLLSGCASTNFDADRAALHAFHEQQQTAHLTYDPALFAAMFNDPLIQLNGGRIAIQTTEENIERFAGYFGSVTFQEWEDIEPPRIRISNDGSMAYAILHKRVRLTYEDDAGEMQEDHTVFAWMEAWEKIDGTWTLMAVASTDRPGEE